MFEFNFQDALKNVGKVIKPYVEDRCAEYFNEHPKINTPEEFAEYNLYMFNLTVEVSARTTAGILMYYHEDLKNYLESKGL